MPSIQPELWVDRASAAVAFTRGRSAPESCTAWVTAMETEWAGPPWASAQRQAAEPKKSSGRAKGWRPAGGGKTSPPGWGQGGGATRAAARAGRRHGTRVRTNAVASVRAAAAGAEGDLVTSAIGNFLIGRRGSRWLVVSLPGG